MAKVDTLTKLLGELGYAVQLEPLPPRTRLIRVIFEGFLESSL
jgi:hypothetical protein